MPRQGWERLKSDFTLVLDSGFLLIIHLAHLHDMAYKFGTDSKRTPVFTATALVWTCRQYPHFCKTNYLSALPQRCL